MCRGLAAERRVVTPSLTYRQLLRTGDVRALLLATSLARLAGCMFMLAIVLYALAHFGSPVLAGWLAFAAVAPGLAISPVAGALIDRVGSVWAVTVDMTASAACVSALIVADRLDWATAPMLLGLTRLYSLTSPLSMAGIRTLLPSLVPADALDRANALDTAINGVLDIVGPALAGVLVGFGGPALALSTIAVTYAAAAICIGSIRSPGGGQLPRPACCSARRGTGCCTSCASRRCVGWPCPIRFTRLPGACLSWWCRSSRHANSPPAWARRRPACSGP